MINRFFWGGDVETHKIHWMCWDKLAKPKKNGGLSFRNFRCFNKAILAKQWWRLATNTETPVSRLYKACYYQNSTIRDGQIGGNPSFMWRSIACAIDSFKSAY